MSKADLHIHTRVSDGLATIDQVLAYVQEETDLAVIGVTDHEDVTGGLRAQELAARRQYRFEVVPGIEVTTLQGHLIGLYIERAPASFRRVESALEMIHTEGGLAVAPHPMSWLTRSISERTIERLFERNEAGILLDGIEVANPSPAGRLTRERALRLNQRWGYAPIGASDAHHLGHIGTGWTEFDGSSADDLRRAILSGEVSAAMSSYPSLREVGLGNLALGLAWGYAATPRKMLQKATTARRKAR